jgi:hypothetical protein
MAENPENQSIQCVENIKSTKEILEGVNKIKEKKGQEK